MMRRALLIVVIVTLIVIAASIAIFSDLDQTVETTDTNINAPRFVEYSFAVAGDFGCTNNTDAVLDSITANDPKLLLALGDLSYAALFNYTYDPMGRDCWVDELRERNLLNKTEIVFGNHEFEDSRLLGNYYKETFNMTNLYDAFSVGNVYFISTTDQTPQSTDSAQYEFVQASLKSAATNPNIDWIIALNHKPPHSSYQSLVDPIYRDTYTPLFEMYGVDLVLVAHTHYYERTFPLLLNTSNPEYPIIADKNLTTYSDIEAIPYITIGTGGAELFNPTGDPDYLAARQLHTWGYLDMTVKRDEASGKDILEGHFLEPDGTIHDTFVLSKKID